MFADDYRGAVVTFSGQFRVRDAGPAAAAGRAGLFLRVAGQRETGEPATEQAAFSDPANTIVTIPDGHDWTSHRVTARVQDDSDAIVFGVFLSGPGRIEMRDAEIARS
jgi:hypothetical protein